MSMTIKDLKEIISNLPDETVILIEENDISEVETVNVQYHSDGRLHLILSVLE
jgi:DNA polymerase III sliding clamp (beta) subunit (PCNA family)